MEDEESKADFQEIRATDNVENLEKDFQRVIQDLVADRSLSKFKDEYQKIFHAVKKSHENNSVLLEKCRTLNSSIVANSTKVNSVLQLSQDDVRTIAGLRFEFEKAWKMVEISQDRENKSRDIIEVLKNEIINLNKIVDVGNHNFLSDSTSASSISTEIKVVQKEIEVQRKQLIDLTEDIEKWKTKTKEYNESTKMSNEEMEMLNNEIEQMKQENLNIQGEFVSNQKSTDESHTVIKYLNSQEDEIADKKKILKKNISLLNEALCKTKKEIREVNDICDDQKARLKVTNDLLDNKYKIRNRIKYQSKQIQKKIDEKDEKLCEKQKSLEVVLKELENVQKDMDLIEIRRKEANEALKCIRKAHGDQKDEIYRLSHEHLKCESKITVTNRLISNTQQQTCDLKNDFSIEKKRKNAVEGQQNGVLNDITNAKFEIHNIRKLFAQFNEEIGQYKSNSQQDLSNALLIETEEKQTREYIKELGLKLLKTQEHLKKHIASEKLLIENRDLIRRQMEQLRVESQQMSDEQLFAKAEIQELKTQIKNKDKLCVSVHLSLVSTCAMLNPLKDEIEKLKVTNKTMATNIAQLANTLVRSRYLVDVAAKDVSSQMRAYQNLEIRLRATEKIIHSKVFESNLLKSKCTTLVNKINSTGGQYLLTVQKVESMKEDLNGLIEKQIFLINQAAHYNVLNLEKLRIEKSVLITRSQARALEDELETPIQIHRWRFLEATNPEQAQQIKMIMNLRDRFMRLLGKKDRFLNKKKNIEENLEKKKMHINHASKQETKEMRHFFDSILHEKTKQLQTLEHTVSEQCSVIGDGRSNVEMVRENLRAVREDFYNTKRKTDDIKSTQSNSGSDPNTTIEQPRFIGGGFFGSTAPSSINASNQIMRNIAAMSLPKKNPIVPNAPILEPQIQKAMRQSALAIIPHGWNTKRTALKPLLPTLAEMKQ